MMQSAPVNSDKQLTAILARVERLEKAVFRDSIKNGFLTKAKTPNKRNLDFDINERAYTKKYAGGHSGQEKFVLILAYLVKGKVGMEVSLADIVDTWSRMSSILGKFNFAFTDRAKYGGLVDTKRKGFYQLTSEWQEVL